MPEHWWHRRRGPTGLLKEGWECQLCGVTVEDEERPSEEGCAHPRFLDRIYDIEQAKRRRNGTCDGWEDE